MKLEYYITSEWTDYRSAHRLHSCQNESEHSKRSESYYPIEIEVIANPYFQLIRFVTKELFIILLNDNQEDIHKIEVVINSMILMFIGRRILDGRSIDILMIIISTNSQMNKR